MKKRCQFQGGAGLKEKYRPAAPCLGEFLVGRQCNEPRQKYCKVCAPFAKKWLSARNANAAYKAEPKKGAKIARENRWKRRRLAGRPCSRLGLMALCKYHNKCGKRGEGCLGKFERKSSSQKFCPVCQKHADADRAQAYRDAHPEKEKARQTLRWQKQREEIKVLREQAAVGEQIAAGKLIPARPIEEITKARITLAAHLQLDGLKPYGMTDSLYPQSSEILDKEKGADKIRRFDTTKKFLKKHQARIDIEKCRLAALPEPDRDSANAARSFIHTFHRLPWGSNRCSPKKVLRGTTNFPPIRHPAKKPSLKPVCKQERRGSWPRRSELRRENRNLGIPNCRIAPQISRGQDQMRTTSPRSTSARGPRQFGICAIFLPHSIDCQRTAGSGVLYASSAVP